MKTCIKCRKPMDNLVRAYKTAYLICFDCEVEDRMDKEFRDITYSPPNHNYACKPKQPVKL